MNAAASPTSQYRGIRATEPAESVLLEIGLDRGEIIALKDPGAIT